MSTRPVTRAGVSRPAASPRVRRAQARRRSWRVRLKTLAALVFLLLETLVAIVLVTILIVFWKFSREQLPHMDLVINDTRAPVATTVLSEDGVVLARLAVENRQPISLKEAPKHLIDATIAIEDHRFYEHPGVDVVGIVRAAWTNLRANTVREGASTLTQQLVRNLQQTGVTREKRLERKVREALTALRLEQIYTKDEILRFYLNHVYYGAGAYGVQAASRTYFGKSAYKLSLAEAALLAGLPQRPSEYNPYVNLRAALARRNEVLQRMHTYGYITQEQRDRAMAEKPKLMPRRRRRNVDYKAPYFVTYVLRQLTDRYGEEFVASGLTIETTLNWEMQKIAEETLRRGLEQSPANQGALVALDPRTGYIRAMVGGRSFYADEYNVVTQGIGRQPGSTFKVFGYTTALEEGLITLDSYFLDTPYRYPGDPKRRVVTNYGGTTSGRSISVRQAIARSVNTVAVRVAEKAGIKDVIQVAYRMGITTPLKPYLSTALGASEVRPLDLCSAYSVFAAGGARCLPMAIVRVTDADGNLVYEQFPQVQPSVLKPSTVAQMDEALKAVVTGGTGTRARGTEASGIIEEARGKTGTTNDNKDAWFAGYTPELTTVIWVARIGRDKRSYPMPGTTGGQVCAPIWHDFMIQAIPIQKRFKLKQPVNTVTVLPILTPEEKKPKPSREAVQIRETPDPPADAPKPAPEAPDGNVLEVPEPGREAGDPASAGASATSDRTTGATRPVSPTPAEPPQRVSAIAPPPALATPPGGAAEISAPRADAIPLRESSVAAPPAGGLRASAPGVSMSVATPVRSAPPPEMRTVRICVDSNALAHDYCPAYRNVTLSARQARQLGRCRMHRPPPGEG
ncbi:MAG: PBP1A family penicillin-binding protein [Chloroherpetonaceae bacterium]|nr:PBP1A family penicillin-binding protein [Chthonomonadaceae bacterium]MDW8206912.1 PBP1A family penicillin-binding protein [Chloroherpetonaceae bacterium]